MNCGHCKFDNFVTHLPVSRGDIFVHIPIIVGAAAGIAASVLQMKLLHMVINASTCKKIVIALSKLLLWAGLMVLMVMWSIPGLIALVAGATAGMLIYTVIHMRNKGDDDNGRRRTTD